MNASALLHYDVNDDDGWGQQKTSEGRGRFARERRTNGGTDCAALARQQAGRRAWRRRSKDGAMEARIGVTTDVERSMLGRAITRAARAISHSSDDSGKMFELRSGHAAYKYGSLPRAARCARTGAFRAGFSTGFAA